MPSRLDFFPKSIFSSTVCSGNTCLSSGTYPIPAMALLLVASFINSLPFNNIEPELTLIKPVIALNVELLPAPFLPSKAMILFFVISKLL